MYNKTQIVEIHVYFTLFIYIKCGYRLRVLHFIVNQLTFYLLADSFNQES